MVTGCELLVDVIVAENNLDRFVVAVVVEFGDDDDEFHC